MTKIRSAHLRRCERLSKHRLVWHVVFQSGGILRVELRTWMQEKIGSVQAARSVDYSLLADFAPERGVAVWTVLVASNRLSTFLFALDACLVATLIELE